MGDGTYEGVEATGRFVLRVEKVMEDCAVPAGLTGGPYVSTVVVGRSPSADFQLSDKTVSSRHVQVGLTGEGFEVVNLSERGTTFVGGEALEPGDRIVAAPDEVWLQLGGVLVRAWREAETQPVGEAMSIPVAGGDGDDVQPLLTFRIVGSHCEVRCRGTAVHLYPTSARLLAHLCRNPGGVATHSELDEAADPENFPRQGGATVPQMVTFARTMFSEAIEAGIVGVDELRGVLVEAGVDEDLEGLDRRELLRLLIENIRGVGYRVRIPGHEIAFVEIE